MVREGTVPVGIECIAVAMELPKEKNTDQEKDEKEGGSHCPGKGSFKNFGGNLRV
ncbi:hypothetical protein N752_29865 [Desulforamulus aquiferis]|nr:hypothetical protein [Desulforamulus aquiferis]RYD01510.1 hypothetical protein N752_29865 [Desulforamulus aquiferis]